MSKRIHWLLLAAAFHLVMWLPLWVSGRRFFLSWWLLPYAGQYAHTDDFAHFLSLKDSSHV